MQWIERDLASGDRNQALANVAELAEIACRLWNNLAQVAETPHLKQADLVRLFLRCSRESEAPDFSNVSWALASCFFEFSPERILDTTSRVCTEASMKCSNASRAPAMEMAVSGS
jgi:hypothetical protein